MLKYFGLKHKMLICNETPFSLFVNNGFPFNAKAPKPVNHVFHNLMWFVPLNQLTEIVTLGFSGKTIIEMRMM